MAVKTTIALAFLAATSAQAHIGRGCSGHDIARRNPGMDWDGKLSARSPGRLMRRYDVNSTDVTAECIGYDYPTVSGSTADFPTIWETAALVSGDTEAAAAYVVAQAQIASLVPNVTAKGTASGDFSSVSYSSTDPDCWWTYEGCDTPSNSAIPADITYLPEPSSFGIGFDDGPNCSSTVFYDYLKTNNQSATMFYIGSNVMDWPLQALRGYENGHQIAIHTWSHQYMTALTDEQVFAELYYTQKAIKLVTGVSPLTWRPPYGDIDNRVRVIAASLNLTAVLWEEDSDDWRIGTGSPAITSADIDLNYQSVIDKANNGTFDERGTIMLTHELNNFTMSEMIKWYPTLKSTFKSVIPIATGMNWTHPYAETNVSFPVFDAASTTSTSANSSGTSATTTGSATSAGTASKTTTAATSTASTGSASRTGPLIGGFACIFAIGASLLI